MPAPESTQRLPSSPRKCAAFALAVAVAAFLGGRLTVSTRASIDTAVVAAQEDYGEDTEAVSEICSAIDDSREIRLRYRGGGWRYVQPRLLGLNGRGDVILHGWQVSGDSESGGLPGFRNFTFVLIDEYRITRSRIMGPPRSTRWPSGIAENLCR